VIVQLETNCGFTIEVINSLVALGNVIPEWQEFLTNHVSGNNLYNDPEHIALRLNTNPQFTPCILVLRRGGEIRGIAPFYCRPDRFPLQLSVIKLAALPIQMLMVFGDSFILAANEDAAACFDAVFSLMAQQPVRFGLLHFEQLTTSTLLWKYCQSNFKGGPNFRFSLASPQLESLHQIHFPPTYSEYLASLNASTRRNLRRYARKLCEGQHARLVRITDPDQVPQFLDQVDRVFRNTWQAKTFGYNPRNDASQIRYFSGIAKHGWLHSYVLANDHGPIAYEIVFHYGGVFHSYERGFDQAWGESRPGTALTFMFIEDFYRDCVPQLFDFGVGDAAYKRSFSNVSQDAAAVYLTLRNRWRHVVGIQRGLFALDRNVRSLLIALRLDRTVRKLLKRQG
jgi:hypothetical protein